MFDGPLQQAAVEAKHIGSLVHYGGDLLELHVAPLQGRGKHQPGRRSAKHPRQQPLGVGDKFGRGLHLGRQGAAMLPGEATKGALDPARADETSRQHLQLLDRDPRLIEGRGITAGIADEVGRLQPLAHRRPRQQGAGHIADDIEQQAQEDAPGPQAQIAKRGPVGRGQQGLQRRTGQQAALRQQGDEPEADPRARPR